MLRKYALFVGVAALGALVTSCGGDDTGSPTPTPSGTATPTPSPTPSQALVDFDLTDDFAAQSTNANYTFAYFTPDSGGDEVFSGASRLNGNAAIEFDPSPDSVTFTFVDLDDPVEFDAADFISGSATMRSYASGTDRLTLELPFNHVLRVRYGRETDFTSGSTDGTLRAQRVALFFNRVTTTSAIASNITYAGSVEVAGGEPGETESGSISAADTTFLVDESDDEIRGTIEVFEDVNGTPTRVAVFAMEADLNANGTFSGEIVDNANDFEGNFAGSLSGPNREEVFILFSASGNDGNDDERRFVGSFIGN
ncbi:hypothetical protein [Aurantiacibacter hainanensis]|uniref:hypothetical protein n=1 Tax=Aurantiacibacter hainanensis TaxID=3076114 RepID=UPI0030C69E31